jgi:hypothetical protein
MIVNPEWLKPKEKPYFHQISMDCLEKLVDCIAKFNKGEIDADTSCQIEKQILTDEIQGPEFLNFAVENISELFGYIATGRVNIRIHRDVTGDIDGPRVCYCIDLKKWKEAEKIVNQFLAQDVTQANKPC